jgi:hypothetical protein
VYRGERLDTEARSRKLIADSEARYSRDGVVERPAINVKGGLLTLVIQRVILQVLLFENEHKKLNAPNPSDAVSQIWPSTGRPESWPSGMRGLDDYEIERLSEMKFTLDYHGRP